MPLRDAILFWRLSVNRIENRKRALGEGGGRAGLGRCMNLIAAAGPPSSSTPFDILTTSPSTTWPRFNRRATQRVFLSRPSNLRALSYHPRRHLNRQLRDEMHGNRTEALITPIADSNRALDRTWKKNRQLFDVSKKESSPPPLLLDVILVSPSFLPSSRTHG